MEIRTRGNLGPGKLPEYISICFSGALGIGTWALGSSCSCNDPVQWIIFGTNRTDLLGFSIFLLSVLQYVGVSMEKRNMYSTLFRLTGAGTLCFLFWQFSKISFSQDPYSLNILVYSLASFTSAWFMFDAIGELRYILWKKKLQNSAESKVG